MIALALANPEADKLELSQFLEDYLDYKRPSIRKKSISEMERIYYQKVIPEIGHIYLARLKPTHIQNVITKDASAGKYSNAYNIRKYLKMALRQAERWELIQRSPAANLEPVKMPSVKRGLWEREEIARFLEAVSSSKFAPIFQLCLYQGLRIGEALALKWSDVDERYIHIRRTYARLEEGKVGPPKTAKGFRSLRYGDEVRDLLERQREVTGKHKSGYVFLTSGGKLHSESNVRRARVAAIKKAGIPMIRTHDMRRIAATFWARKGYTPKQIQDMLGHSTPTLALTVYTDVLKEQQDEAFLTAEDLIGK
jgi:integrase